MSNTHHTQVCVLETPKSRNNIKNYKTPKNEGFLDHEKDKTYKTQKHLVWVS